MSGNGRLQGTPGAYSNLVLGSSTPCSAAPNRDCERLELTFYLVVSIFGRNDSRNAQFMATGSGHLEIGRPAKSGAYSA